MALTTLDDQLENAPAGHQQTFRFTITDVTAGVAPVDGVINVNVPPGHNFTPTSISVTSNAAATAGIQTTKVTSGGVEVVGGPESVIDTVNTLINTGTVRAFAVILGPGAELGVSATGDGAFAPITADFDVVLTGILYNN